MRIFILICCWVGLFWVTPLMAKPLPAVQLQLLVAAVTVDQYEIAVLITTQEALPEAQLSFMLNDNPLWTLPSLNWSGALAIGEQRLVLVEQLRLADFPATLRAELRARDRYGEQHYAQANVANQATAEVDLPGARSLDGRNLGLAPEAPGLHLIELSRP